MVGLAGQDMSKCRILRSSVLNQKDFFLSRPILAYLTGFSWRQRVILACLCELVARPPLQIEGTVLPNPIRVLIGVSLEGSSFERSLFRMCYVENRLLFC